MTYYDIWSSYDSLHSGLVGNLMSLNLVVCGSRQAIRRYQKYRLQSLHLFSGEWERWIASAAEAGLRNCEMWPVPPSRCENFVPRDCNIFGSARQSRSSCKPLKRPASAEWLKYDVLGIYAYTSYCMYIYIRYACYCMSFSQASWGGLHPDLEPELAGAAGFRLKY